MTSYRGQTTVILNVTVDINPHAYYVSGLLPHHSLIMQMNPALMNSLYARSLYVDEAHNEQSTTMNEQT